MKDTDFYSTIRLQAKLGESNKWLDWQIRNLNPESPEGKEFIENFKKEIQALEGLGYKNKYRIVVETYYIPV